MRRALTAGGRALWLLLVAGLLLALASALAPALPALAGGPFTVDSVNDTHDAAAGNGLCADSGGQCSLRAAIEEATALGGATTINLPVGTYALSLGELRLGSTAATDITLIGQGAAASTIIRQTDRVNRVFNIDFSLNGNVTASIRNVTIRDGVGGPGGGGGAILDGDPGDVLNISNVNFVNNRTSQFNGGAISFTGGGTLNVTNSAFTGNLSPTGNGGAIHFLQTQAGSFQVTNTTFSGNSAIGGALGGQGGAVNAGCNICSPFAITGSTFVNNTAVPVNGSGGQGGALMLGSGNATLSYNRIVGNSAGTGLGSGIYHGGSGTIKATDNWWGCNTGPGGAGCDSAVSSAGTLAVSPFIVLANTANPAAVMVNQDTTLTASFQQDSAGTPIAPGNLGALGGRAVIWSNATRGSFSAAQATTGSGGTATAVFTANAAGAGSAAVTVEQTTATANITIKRATTTTAITADAPDPSLTGQTVAVTYAVSSATGSTPSALTGVVTVSDGTDSCTGTVTAGTCSLILTTAGRRTLTATYAGDANFAGSTSAGEPHKVLQLRFWLLPIYHSDK